MPNYRINYTTPYISGYVPRNFCHEFSKKDDLEAEQYAEKFIDDNKLDPSITSLVKIIKPKFPQKQNPTTVG